MRNSLKVKFKKLLYFDVAIQDIAILHMEWFSGTQVMPLTILMNTHFMD